VALNFDELHDFLLKLLRKGQDVGETLLQQVLFKGVQIQVISRNCQELSDPTQHWFFSVQQNLVPTAAG